MNCVNSTCVSDADTLEKNFWIGAYVMLIANLLETSVVTECEIFSMQAKIGKRLVVCILSAILIGIVSLYLPSPQLATGDGVPTCNGIPATIVGDDDPNILEGTDGNDVIVGKGGGDTIYAKGGFDHVCGDGGYDKIYGGDGSDVIKGGSGGDYIYGGNGNDIMRGEDGNDKLDGGNGSDTANGGAGTDTCSAELRLSCKI